MLGDGKWTQTRMLDVSGVRHTISLDRIKRGYYSIKALNPWVSFPWALTLSPLGL